MTGGEADGPAGLDENIRYVSEPGDGASCVA